MRIEPLGIGDVGSAVELVTRALRVDAGDRGEQFACDIAGESRQMFVAKVSDQVFAYGRVVKLAADEAARGAPVGAASALAYEFASRVQAEIEGLGWISSPQRVTSMDAANLTISGWSAGMLARFRVRDGRLRRWSQRPCSLASAAPALAATPAVWRDFAQRNAELAASLAQPS